MKTGPNQSGESRRGLARLVYDTAGNTMLMMGAAMIPIIGMVGSAFDMSRAYMVKSRLQQACDAGVLAGRRAMTEPDFDDDDLAQTQADNFFNFNFADGSFGSTDLSFTPSGTDDGQVSAVASATVPMTLMSIFNVPSIEMSVDCDARLEIANNDIMFVLDVTGSMAWDAAGNDVGGGPTSRIVALRAAVNAFYTTLEENTSESAQIRYGFVPFSSGVNVGQLLLDSSQPGYLVNTHRYMSRLANYTTADHLPQVGTPSAATVQIYSSGTGISSSDCDKYGRNVNFGSFTGSGSPIASGGPPPTATSSRAYSNNEASGVDWGWSGATDTSGTTKSCRRRYVDTPTTYNTRYKFTNWSYPATGVQFDTSQYKLGNAVTLANGNTPGGTVATSNSYNIQQLVSLATVPTSVGTALATATYTWNRCIEERDTLSDATFPSIPSGAHDLQIDEIPNSDATRWRPMWGRLVHVNNSNSNPTTQCPAAAQKLRADMEASDISTYVNGLSPVGSTYLDYGIIWGARLVSPTGIFGAENITAPNGRPINRHVIFMTDGAMDPDSTLYTMYGYEPRDRRITGTASVTEANLRARHKQRFTAICRALKDDMNITVWTIAFATAQEPEMLSCATPGKALIATTTADLVVRFTEIANRIAELRLAQ